MKLSKTWLAVIGLAGLSIILSAAQKEKAITYKPTPYKLSLPEFVYDYFEPMPMPANNPMTQEGVALGRYLFYDGILSENRTMSCGGCHRQANAFSDPRQFSFGVRGDLGIKQSMSLVNLGWSHFLFWDGRAKSLEAQGHDPITNPIEMASNWKLILPRLQTHADYPKMFYKAFGTTKIDSSLVLKALSQFQRSIVSFNSRFDAYFFGGDASVFTKEEERGMDLFFSEGASCNHCHSDVLLTDNFFRNNGLDLKPDSGMAKNTLLAKDIGKMRVPTLRNIALTAPYMHDGRFKTLEEVVNFYFDKVNAQSPNLDEHMTMLTNRVYVPESDRKALVAFLKTFTDSTLIQNKAYSDPFAFDAD
ncbi:cytochrome-c peroxidase [Taibaiella sp. KBW10]|uniref:cytochrome-c peroxidase n=1 Tax=Taibaiella sp. KBW10 TaxID=2153357 RepID=UPI000F5A466A|nr:cytochrome c peroxidase [Taibaiella sp. KBW10]RQO31471.1 cytochrome-c peroxidase [Taibaiella sp. KBW10]